jgi:hypothetical protein
MLGHVSSVNRFWSSETAFGVRSMENILCSIRVTENASDTPMIGSLNVYYGDKSSDHSSMKMKKKRVWKCNATREIILWPKRILMGLANLSNLGLSAYVVIHFLDVYHIQDLSPVMPHSGDVA